MKEVSKQADDIVKEIEKKKVIKPSPKQDPTGLIDTMSKALAKHEAAEEEMAEKR
jgi:hypothetical protein